MLALMVTVAIAAVTITVYAFFPRLVVVAVSNRKFAGAAAYLIPYVYATAMLALANVIATYNIARERMAFIVPLGCVAAGEIVAVVVRHRSAADLLQTIAVGHTLALIATSVSLGGARHRGLLAPGPVADGARMTTA